MEKGPLGHRIIGSAIGGVFLGITILSSIQKFSVDCLDLETPITSMNRASVKDIAMLLDISSTRFYL